MKFIYNIYCYNCRKTFSTEEDRYSHTFCPYCGKKKFKALTIKIKQETLEEKFKKLKI